MSKKVEVYVSFSGSGKVLIPASDHETADSIADLPDSKITDRIDPEQLGELINMYNVEIYDVMEME